MESIRSSQFRYNWRVEYSIKQIIQYTVKIQTSYRFSLRPHVMSWLCCRNNSEATDSLEGKSRGLKAIQQRFAWSFRWLQGCCREL